MKHKHKFQLLGYGREILRAGNFQENRTNRSKVIFVCECGKRKDVELK